MMDELKLCPFCGSKAVIIKNYKGQTSIECTNRLYCIASRMVFWDYEEDAVNAWNRRANDGKND